MQSLASRALTTAMNTAKKAETLKKLAGLVQLILSDNKVAVIHLAC